MAADLNSYGVRAESTRKQQAPIERKPLRVLVPARSSRIGPQPKAKRMAPAYLRLLHLLAPLGVTKLKSAEVAPYAYDAYAGGRITAPQARALGCVVRGNGTKPETVNRDARNRKRRDVSRRARRASR